MNSRLVGVLKLFSCNICSVNGELLTLANLVRSVWANGMNLLHDNYIILGAYAIVQHIIT